MRHYSPHFFGHLWDVFWNMSGQAFEFSVPDGMTLATELSLISSVMLQVKELQISSRGYPQHTSLPLWD